MLSAAEFVRAQLKRLHTGLEKSLADLTPQQMHAVPGGHPKANTIAWGLWHYARTEDNIVRWVIQERRPPIWTEGGYGERLGLPPVAQGTGMSTEEAHALRIKDLPLFQEYMQKVWAGTEELFAGANPALFEKMVTVKPLGEMSVIQCLGQVGLIHGMTHLGELELARTLVGAGPVSGV
ncbi:MAG: DinB family protein [Candidatus Rokuibacteriota bacterium]